MEEVWICGRSTRGVKCPGTYRSPMKISGAWCRLCGKEMKPLESELDGAGSSAGGQAGGPGGRAPARADSSAGRPSPSPRAFRGGGARD